jgi:hypothetical protein
MKVKDINIKKGHTLIVSGKIKAGDLAKHIQHSNEWTPIIDFIGENVVELTYRGWDVCRPNKKIQLKNKYIGSLP